MRGSKMLKEAAVAERDKVAVAVVVVVNDVVIEDVVVDVVAVANAVVAVANVEVAAMHQRPPSRLMSTKGKDEVDWRTFCSWFWR